MRFKLFIDDNYSIITLNYKTILNFIIEYLSFNYHNNTKLNSKGLLTFLIYISQKQIS